MREAVISIQKRTEYGGFERLFLLCLRSHVGTCRLEIRTWG